MLSRRDILLGAARMAGAAAFAGPARNVLASAPEPRTPVSFHVPAGSCDCHTHIFDPERFPYAASRPYTPETASIADVRALLEPRAQKLAGAIVGRALYDGRLDAAKALALLESAAQGAAS